MFLNLHTFWFTLLSVGGSDMWFGFGFEPLVLVATPPNTHTMKPISSTNREVDGPHFECQHLDCYWVGSADFNFLGSKGVFHETPNKINFCRGVKSNQGIGWARP